MKLTVYLDVLLVTNLIINYFLLKATANYYGLKAGTARMLLASFIGGAFSLSILADLPFFISMVWKLISLLVCVAVAFGIKSRVVFIKTTICLITITFIFTGFITAISQNSSVVFIRNMQIYMNISPLVLVSSIVVVYIFITAFEFAFEFSKKEYNYSIEIYYGSNSCTGCAFYDTGFKVKDVITFKNVMLCDFDFIKPILPQDLCENITDFYHDGIYKEKGIIPVFYSDLNNSGMLPGAKLDKVILSSKNEKKVLDNILMAVSPQKISEDCDVIFGKDINKMVGRTND